MEKIFQQPSVMTAQQHFSQAPSAQIPRSTFDRSHACKTTFDAGACIPVYVDEVLPGDTFKMDARAFCRLATPLKPFMDNINLDIHFFFVPYRLVWVNWQKFMGERDNPADDPDIYTVPQALFNLSTTDGTHLVNYMGLPRRTGVGAVTNFAVSALPFRAYRKIWNDWYRDQNLINSLAEPDGDGPDDYNGAMPSPRGKRHDYFTSCLPWPQKGDPVIIPLGTTAPVLGIGVQGAPVNSVPTYTQSTGATIPPGTPGWLSSTASAVFVDQSSTAGRPDIFADLSAASTVTINDLRTAFQIQKLLERDARGGTRYIELILSHFGVRSSDARLQRPEYLGGGTTRVNINPIASTVSIQGGAPVPQANLAATGTSLSSAGFEKSFEEHGVIIGIASARADLTYQQGCEKFWKRRTRYDFYWPAFAHLGEQAVFNHEIFISDNTVTNGQIFGYQERHAEYRYKPSRVTGLFNSEVAAPLDVWHLAQDFSTTPVLNASFIHEAPPIDRVIAVPSEPHFLADFWFDLKCTRPMPVYAVPGLIDHF